MWTIAVQKMTKSNPCVVYEGLDGSSHDIMEISFFVTVYLAVIGQKTIQEHFQKIDR